MTKLVGILNITPDSFSDGGKFTHIDAALSQVDSLIAEGASVIDIGAESTRPGSTLISAADEWSRLDKILPAILDKYRNKAEFSIDTRHAEIAEKAISLGIDWINDVSGFSDSGMINICKNAKKIVLMHNLGVPADPSKTMPAGFSVIDEIIKWAEAKIALLQNEGINKKNIIFDPGIGFGKTKEQSLEIVKSVGKFNSLEVPVMIGHSRKSFLTIFSDKKAEERDFETSVISAYLSLQKVSYLRVHNLKMNRLAVDIFTTLERNK